MGKNSGRRAQTFAHKSKDADPGIGPSRHFAALRYLVGIEGIADIEQAAPINLDLCGAP
jgi:hypothetical protein